MQTHETEQERRRAMNEQRRQIFTDPGRPIAFVCECGGDECARTVVLTQEEYDALRLAQSNVTIH